MSRRNGGLDDWHLNSGAHQPHSRQMSSQSLLSLRSLWRWRTSCLRFRSVSFNLPAICAQLRSFPTTPFAHGLGSFLPAPGETGIRWRLATLSRLSPSPSPDWLSSPQGSVGGCVRPVPRPPFGRSRSVIFRPGRRCRVVSMAIHSTDTLVYKSQYYTMNGKWTVSTQQTNAESL